MQLERLALHLRRRSPLEAIDLGCAMARTWWKPVLAAWLTLYIPATVLVHLLLSGNSFAAMAVLWWLKPLFDRAALDVLSRGVFGERARVRDVLRSVMRSPGILSSLTIYRFDLARSFNLPIWHLERLSGSAGSQRARALHGRSRRHAVWTTIVFLHFELVITLSIWGAIGLLTPSQLDSDLGLRTMFFPDNALWQEWLNAAVYALTVTLLEPFYVAAGFALYLNRRTQLEAWDVELALRRFAKVERERPRAAALAAILVLACVFIAWQPADANAAERGASAPAETIRQILATPEFAEYKDVKRLQYTGRGWNFDPSSPEKNKDASVVGTGLFGEALRALMWVAAAVLVFYVLYLARRYMGAWLPEARARRRPPGALFGLEIAPESLPPDVPAAALAAVEAGRAREALSLLYRGALSVLVNSGALEVAAGDTEGDCVRRVAAQEEGGKSRYFADLVAAWQGTAYAGRIPQGERLRALCSDWRAHFGEAAA